MLLLLRVPSVRRDHQACEGDRDGWGAVRFSWRFLLYRAGSLSEIILLVLRKGLLARLQDVLRLEGCLRDAIFFVTFHSACSAIVLSHFSRMNGMAGRRACSSEFARFDMPFVSRVVCLQNFRGLGTCLALILKPSQEVSH